MTSLIADNALLLEQHVDEKLVGIFVELLRQKGPEPRFLGFLQVQVPNKDECRYRYR